MNNARICIVEDDMIIAYDLKRQLQAHGFADVRLFASGEALLGALGGGYPDLLVMDYLLGKGMNGVDASRRVKAQRDIPVLFITGNSNLVEEIKIGAGGGGVRVLSKPVAEDTLLENVHFLLQAG